MTTATGTCARCGRARSDDERVCGLCGSLLGAAPASRPAAVIAPPSDAPASAARLAAARAPTSVERVESALRAREVDEARSRARAPWLHFAIGLATAPVFALTPVLQLMGWFLASLVHEMGHAGTAWALGLPAIPAISPTGHAAAVHGEPSVLLALLVLGGLVVLAWRAFEGRARVVACTAVAVLQPLLAFTPAREVAFLLAGHGGELAFAVLCLVRTLDGGFTSSTAERALYGTVGWFLVGRNALLGLGLATSSASRAQYASNGSFGLENDLIRAARDHFGCRVETLGALLALASVVAVAAAIGIWRLRRAAR